MSIAGSWNYDWVDQPLQYGVVWTYVLGMHYLEDVALVEDWGCGCAFSRRFRRGAYRGIDGSPSRWTDHVADLETYRSQTPGLFMRHVLEHNPNWRTILANALTSFTERMVLITFMPFRSEQAESCPCDAGLALHAAVPNIYLPEPELLSMLQPYLTERITIQSRELETVFLLTKSSDHRPFKLDNPHGTIHAAPA
jgi:hypothetical protein